MGWGGDEAGGDEEGDEPGVAVGGAALLALGEQERLAIAKDEAAEGAEFTAGELGFEAVIEAEEAEVAVTAEDGRLAALEEGAVAVEKFDGEVLAAEDGERAGVVGDEAADGDGDNEADAILREHEFAELGAEVAVGGVFDGFEERDLGRGFGIKRDSAEGGAECIQNLEGR